MEELQVIETTSGRQFKPWASREDVQAIKQETVQAVAQAVQDPASITAIASEIAGGKQAIASAINAKGGTASETDSFTELAEAVENIPNFNTAGTEWVEGYTPTSLNEAYNLTYLKSITNTAITTLGSDTAVSGSNLGFRSLLYLEYINLPNCETIPYQCFNSMPALRELILPKVTIFRGQYGVANAQLAGTVSIVNLVLGRLTDTAYGLAGGSLSKLRNITIGDLTNTNLQFNAWTATSVIAEGQSAIDELNTNLQTNLISKLYQGGGKILRLGAALYDVTTQETRDMVTAKGWTLQRG